MKYLPQYPLKPFSDITEVRKWVTKLVEWYNNEHRHSAIGFVTPVHRHEGLDGQVLNNRVSRLRDCLREKRKALEW